MFTLVFVDKMFYEHDEHKKKRKSIVALTAVTSSHSVGFVHSKWLAFLGAYVTVTVARCMDIGYEYVFCVVYMDLCIFVLIFIAFNASGMYSICISLEQRDMISRAYIWARLNENYGSSGAGAKA